MPKKPSLSAEETELRRQAEARLREQGSRPSPAQPDAQRLVHELQVHQIELELQNVELQRARDEMEAGLEKYSDLYDFAPVGFLTLDRDGTIREANLTCASLLGVERSRLLRRRLGLQVSAADAMTFKAFLKRIFESTARESCEVTLAREGKPPLEVRIEAVMAASKRECRAVLEDITAHKRAEADRLILNKLESTGILAGGLAHDFNNLLAVILLNLDLARALTPPGEELARRLEEARKAALASRSLTQQLITFATGGQPIRKPTLLSGLIPDFVRPALSGSRVRCEFSLANDLWSAEVDTGQFGQVLRNLVLNAREAMPHGGVISVRAENLTLGAEAIPALPHGDYIRVSVADQGEGISKEVLPKVFDPYFSTKQRGDQKGMGLGLTICHTIVQKHGGAITVDSEVGRGSTFHIHLPATRGALRPEKPPVPETVPRPCRVLVMDDEEGIRKVMGVLLRRMGHEVELVQDGQEAVEVYARAQAQGGGFDAVLLDLTVRAGIGGQEAVRALHHIDPAVKAIVMSGYASDPVLLEPQRHGFLGVLAKPFDGDGLRTALGKVLSP